MHYQKNLAIFVLSVTATLTGCGSNEIEHIGILQNRPVETAGVWVIDGTPYRANYKTKLVQKNGPLGIGSCVGIAMSRGIVTEIESENSDACSRQQVKPR